MGKGNLRFGGKLGVLPRLRQVFKQPYKQLQIAVPTENELYADERFVPRRAHVPRPKVVVPLEAKLKAQAPEGSKMKRPEWEARNAELRKDAYRKAVVFEHARLEAQEEQQQKRAAAQEASRQKRVNYKESEVVGLTVPTVQQSLDGPIMRRRTPEEQAELAEKRRANRLHQELEVERERARRVLELYNALAEFAIDEPLLEKMVAVAFDINHSQADRAVRQIEQRLASGTAPGVSELDIVGLLTGLYMDRVTPQDVEDTLSGHMDQLKRDARVQLDQIERGA